MAAVRSTVREAYASNGWNSDIRVVRSCMTPLRPTAFIIKSGERYLCPVCGYDGTFQGNHYDDDEGGCIGTGIRSSCLFEPGFDDDPSASAEASDSIGASVKSYRAAWLAAGAPWRGGSSKSPPADWKAEAQLRHLFQTAPWLLDL